MADIAEAEATSILQARRRAPAAQIGSGVAPSFAPLEGVFAFAQPAQDAPRVSIANNRFLAITRFAKPNRLMGGVDVIFANPPFGTEITIDDPRILSQFEVGSVWDPAGGGFVRRTTKDEKPVLQSSQPPEVLFVERRLQFLKPDGRMAIVLPNGLLNNPRLAYFRQVVLSQAQLLAVVDMHRDLFQPRNDTQTSMVLLRKWGVGESTAGHGDYPGQPFPPSADDSHCMLCQQPLADEARARMTASRTSSGRTRSGWQVRPSGRR